MGWVMGIDGGGSHLRVAIVTPDLHTVAESQAGTANPVVIGPDAARAIIQATLRAALEAARLCPEQIAAVGIGIAGAAPCHSASAVPWLRDVVTAVLPQTLVVPSADYEIALVGALGERVGVLVLAGTGSLAYGVNEAGESALAGAWGYLLDDAGSGYWLGRQALKAVARAADGRAPATALSDAVLSTLQLPDAYALVPWLYDREVQRTREVAALAPLVLAEAEAGDLVAADIVTRACDELTLAARTVIRRLGMESPPIAFAGGLLTAPNPLSRMLCRALDLPALPQPRYPPVIGAALLALNALSP
ncbi:MAG: BadF/BadG/BcrA/BcrD ATPase family protein [Aggregatilineaceae bacterium]